MRPQQIFIFLALFAFCSCTKETAVYQSATVLEYQPLQVGKYITYRTDSTVFTNFGRTVEVHSYQERHTLDAQIPDALGRPSYRIMRTLRDLAGNQPWKPAGSYFITPLKNTIEVIENNLRFVKLVQPIKQDYKWKGNGYLASNPYGSLYNFSNDDLMTDWDYQFSGIDETVVLNGKTLNNVITVQSIDESVNVPITSTQSYAFKNYAVQKFAKGIGLVYEELIMWEYQPNTGGSSGGYQIGFGIKRTILDNN